MLLHRYVANACVPLLIDLADAAAPQRHVFCTRAAGLVFGYMYGSADVLLLDSHSHLCRRALAKCCLPHRQCSRHKLHFHS